MELAAGTHGVDLIVGGHSHSYLGDPSNPLSQGPYPTIIKNLKGENTLIVQVSFANCRFGQNNEHACMH